MGVAAIARALRLGRFAGGLAIGFVGFVAAGSARPAPRQASQRPAVDRAGSAGCKLVTVGNTIANGNITFFIPLGRAANQVFLAQDTLVSKITVWKPALPETLDNPMQLFVIGADSSFADSIAGPNPNPLSILLQSPIVNVPHTDGIHPTAVPFAFDPPFALPKRGYFAFAIKEALCGGQIALLGDTLNSYSDGALWKTVPNNDCSALGNNPRATRGGTADLVFQIDFCDQTVPAMPETWGRLKARYH